jgi:hypothetical protein
LFYIADYRRQNSPEAIEQRRQQQLKLEAEMKAEFERGEAIRRGQAAGGEDQT